MFGPENIESQNVFIIDDITFTSNFENGNMLRVEKGTSPHEFLIWSAFDNHGTNYQSKHCTWFHFAVIGVPQGVTLKLAMMNSNKHGNLYKYDMRPVYKCSSTNNKWVRIRNPVQFSKIDETAPLSFTHVVDVSDGKVYFSFTYPYTYTMVQDELNAFSEHVNDLTNENAIYYRQELLMNSLDDKRVDLLTISSSYGASTQTEEAISGLFPNASTEQRCYVFPSKEVIFVSSRVHPGEVPAQHVFKGILDLLMDPHDLRAIELRKRYVFKLIPMLNPDGVCRGHFRMDQLGKNLNRYYGSPTSYEQPSIYAAKTLLDFYANSSSSLALYLDLHAHASKRGCFVYGNVMDSLEDQVQNQLYTRLVAMNTPHFDYEGCLFSRDHMSRVDPGEDLTAEGSGRVATYLSHKIIHCYTLECNYNTGRIVNEIAASERDAKENLSLNAVNASTICEKYTPSTYADVGQACMVAMLDIRGFNPCSRILNSKFKLLDRVRLNVLNEVRQRPEYRGQTLRRKSSSNRLGVAVQEGVTWRCKVPSANVPPDTARSAPMMPSAKKMTERTKSSSGTPSVSSPRGDMKPSSALPAMVQRVGEVPEVLSRNEKFFESSFKRNGPLRNNKMHPGVPSIETPPNDPKIVIPLPVAPSGWTTRAWGVRKVLSSKDSSLQPLMK